MDFSYRGISNNSYSLLPGILRETVRNGNGKSEEVEFYYEDEYEILSHFIKEASSYITNINRDDYLSWLEYAQHFGCPTRLLDFTSNPLVALYFCCKDKSKTDGSVWIINEINFENWYRQSDFVINNKPTSRKQIINSIIAEMKGDHQNTEMKRPVSHFPFYIDQRMVAQSSRFLIWGADKRSLEEIVSEKEYMRLSPDSVRIGKSKDTRFLFKYDVPSDNKDNILKQLNTCGINEKALFPGPDGIGRFIADIYRTNKSELLDSLGL